MNKLLRNILTLGIALSLMSIITVHADRSFSLPDQTGQSGKFLQTDGTNPLWANPMGSGGGGTIGGAVTGGTANSVLYVDPSGNLGQDNPAFTYAQGTHVLNLGSTSGGISAYNTVDETTNYERALSSWISNVYTIQTQAGGTGTGRDLFIGSGAVLGTQYSQVGGNGYKMANTIGTTSNAGTAGIISNQGTLTATSVTQNFYGITPTLTQSGTAGYNALFISPYESTIGSGTRLLINAGTNSAANGSGTNTSVLTLNSTGVLSIPGSGTGNGRISLGSGSGINSRFLLGTDGLATASPFGTMGFGLQVAAAQYISSMASGTVAVEGTHTFGIPTLNSINNVTLTNASTLYVDGAPIAGTGSGTFAITNPWALYVNSGNSYFGGSILGQSLSSTGIVTAGNFGFTSGFQATGQTISGSTNTSGLLFGGASSIQARAWFNGGTSSTLSTGTSYANTVIGSSPVTTFSSGTHALLANLVVNPIGTVTSGGAAVTKTATLYVNGENSSGNANYGIFVNNATSFIAGYGVSLNTFTSTANTINLIQSTIECNATSGSQVDTLPPAASAFDSATGQGQIYTLKKVDSGVNTCTLKGNGSENIDGANTKVITIQYNNVQVQSNGTGWDIL